MTGLMTPRKMNRLLDAWIKKWRVLQLGWLIAGLLIGVYFTRALYEVPRLFKEEFVPRKSGDPMMQGEAYDDRRGE